jgi:hypothetical protein
MCLYKLIKMHFVSKVRVLHSCIPASRFPTQQQDYFQQKGGKEVSSSIDHTLLLSMSTS